MSLDQGLIDAYKAANDEIIATSDWMPDDDAKLLRLIAALLKKIFLSPSVAAHGGSDAEEIRFNLDVWNEQARALQGQYRMLTNRKVGSYRTHQPRHDNRRRDLLVRERRPSC